MSVTRWMQSILAMALLLIGAGGAEAQYFKPNNVGQPFQSKPAPAPAPRPAPQPAPQPVIQQFKAAASPAPLSTGALPAPRSSGIAGSTSALRPIAPPQAMVTPQQPSIIQQFQAPGAPKPLSAGVLSQPGSSGIAASTPAMPRYTAPTPQTGSGTGLQGSATYVPYSSSRSGAVTYSAPPSAPILPSSAFQNSGVAGSTPSIVGVVPPPAPGRPNFAAGSTPPATPRPLNGAAAPSATVTKPLGFSFGSNPFPNATVPNTTPSLPYSSTAPAQTSRPAFGIQATSQPATSPSGSVNSQAGDASSGATAHALLLARIGETGQVGELALEALGGVGQKFFPTSQGARFVDRFAEGAIHEAKVGYQYLSKAIEAQITKDAEIVESGQALKAVWHFFRSPQTGDVGPSGPLRDALNARKIEIDIVE